MSIFLVLKPWLGNALGEKPRLLVNKQLEAGASSQRRSQAGAWERGKSRYEHSDIEKENGKHAESSVVCEDAEGRYNNIKYL